MKVLGISAGTKNGNNDAICKEALMGAQEQGAEVSFIRLFDLNIEHCNGCIACVNGLMSGKGGKCVKKDDFEWLKSQMFEADAILFAVPIFEKGAAGIFHTITDRFGPRMDKAMNVIGTKIAESTSGTVPDPRIFKDKVVSYIGIGGSDWVTRVQCDFEMLSMIPIWKTIDNEVFPWSKCIIMEDDKVKRAHEIGENLAKAAANIQEAKFMGDSGICPHCHSRNFHLRAEGTKASCCVCGIEGEIQILDGKLAFVFPEEQLLHAHDTMPGKFLHVDDIKENEGKLNELKKSPEFKERQEKYKSFLQPMMP